MVTVINIYRPLLVIRALGSSAGRIDQTDHRVVLGPLGSLIWAVALLGRGARSIAAAMPQARLRAVATRPGDLPNRGQLRTSAPSAWSVFLGIGAVGGTVREIAATVSAVRCGVSRTGLSEAEERVVDRTGVERRAHGAVAPDPLLCRWRDESSKRVPGPRPPRPRSSRALPEVARAAGWFPSPDSVRC